MEVDEAQRLFLNRYNRRVAGGWDQDLAVTSGVKAASQHNALYARSSSSVQRALIRNDWKRLLRATASSYTEPVDSAEYECHVQALADEMNTRHSMLLRHADELPQGVTAGFRISHAQKSLSVYLKHLWCMGIIAMPPECPVDRVVLRKAGATGSWTRVGTLDEHRSMIAALEQCAGDASLAEWELLVFM